MWSMIISMAVYFFASWKTKILLTDFGVDGLARNLAAGMLALGASSCCGWAIDAAFPAQAIHLFSMGGDASQQDQQAQLESAIKALQAAQNTH
jgi:hypothetical protein